MDREEFGRRVLAAREQLYRIACGQLREPQDRLDAVQEAVFKAWRALPRLRNEQYFESWLVRILLNECHNLQRARKRAAPLERYREPSLEPDFEVYALRQALDALPEKLRLPLLLHYMSGYRTEEIARILRVPTGTVRSRMKRGRDALRKELEAE